MRAAAHALSPAEAQRWTRVGLLAALAMLLGYAETFVPIPVPGVKLGLANVAVLAALATGDVAGACCVALIKVLATGLLFGSPLTLAYSLAGTMLSFVGMAPLSRLRTMRLFMVSVVGSLLHEMGQLAVASAVLGTSALWLATPLLLVAGCITGVITGLLAEQVASALPPLGATAPRCVADTSPQRPPTSVIVRFCALLGFSVVALRAESVPALAGCVASSAVACALARVTPRALLRPLRMAAVVGVFACALQWMVAPATALAEAGRATARLVALMLAGMAFMRAVPTGDLTGTVAWLVSPLGRLGVRTEGFVLAFDVAVRLLPTLGRMARERLAGDGRRLSPRALRAMVPELFGELCRVQEGEAESGERRP